MLASVCRRRPWRCNELALLRPSLWFICISPPPGYSPPDSARPTCHTRVKIIRRVARNAWASRVVMMTGDGLADFPLADPSLSLYTGEVGVSCVAAGWALPSRQIELFIPQWQTDAARQLVNRLNMLRFAYSGSNPGGAVTVVLPSAASPAAYSLAPPGWRRYSDCISA